MSPPANKAIRSIEKLKALQNCHASFTARLFPFSFPFFYHLRNKRETSLGVCFIARSNTFLVVTIYRIPECSLRQSTLRQHIIGGRGWRRVVAASVRRIRVAVDRVKNRGEIVAPTTRYHRVRGRTGENDRREDSLSRVRDSRFTLHRVVGNKFEINASLAHG